MKEIIHLINEMAPYLLLGFGLAGLMHAFIPQSYYRRFLAGGSFRSVLYAALFGIPLPLCSCGVIPTAMSLRKEGASKGATVSFMIATPQTGVDSIIATFSLMGLPFAIVRPIAALVTALFGGTVVNAFVKEDATAATSSASAEEKHLSFLGRIRLALRYAYFEMMQDIGKWLVIGLVIAGLITIFIPDEFFAVFHDNTFASMLLVLCIAIPMYLCATGSIPIAVALMMKGLTPGAALVLLMAGPACNFASILVVNKILGRKTMIAYLASIIIGAVGFGTAIDVLQQNGMVDFMAHLKMVKMCCVEDSWFSIGCSVALLLLVGNALLRKYLKKEDACESCATDADVCEKEMTIHITGMHCNHCSAAAEKALNAVEGVTQATVDLATNSARITGNPTREAMAKALEDIGFGLE